MFCIVGHLWWYLTLLGCIVKMYFCASGLQKQAQGKTRYTGAIFQYIRSTIKGTTSKYKTQIRHTLSPHSHKLFSYCCLFIARIILQLNNNQLHSKEEIFFLKTFDAHEQVAMGVRIQQSRVE